jgi:CheY-like chemotaxis protein
MTVTYQAAAPEGLDVLTHWQPHVLVSDIEMPGEDAALIPRHPSA